MSVAAVVLADALIKAGAKDPTARQVLSMIKGFRNGVVYGTKVRAPHSLLMCIVFKEGSWKEKAKFIAETTFTHAKNLASLVFLYKGLTGLLRYFQKRKHPLHSVISGFIAGYFIYGNYNKVNEQVCLYLLSRIVYAAAQLAVKQQIIPQPKFHSYPWFAAIMWAIVMWMFEYHKETLQPSLQNSMTYLYTDSDKFTNFHDLLVHNSCECVL